MDDPAKELSFQGVYRIAPDGKVTLLTKEMERPNGIAFSPDEKTLYVANSHGPRPIWMAFPMNDDGTLGKGREFFDATELAKTRKGAADGMKVDEHGNLFATGPGGVSIFSPDGKHWARSRRDRRRRTSSSARTARRCSSRRTCIFCGFRDDEGE